jgi:hypothetical protein
VHKKLLALTLPLHESLTLRTQLHLDLTLRGSHSVSVEVGFADLAVTIFSMRHTVSHVSFLVTKITSICHNSGILSRLVRSVNFFAISPLKY